MVARSVLPLALMIVSILSGAASAACEPTACAQRTYDFVVTQSGRVTSVAHHVVTDGASFSQSTYDTAVTCSGRWSAVLLQEPTSGRIVPVTVGCAQAEAGHAGTYAGKVSYNAGVLVRVLATETPAFVTGLLA